MVEQISSGSVYPESKNKFEKSIKIFLSIIPPHDHHLIPANVPYLRKYNSNRVNWSTNRQRISRRINCQVSSDSNSFLRTWLPFKVRKCQKETLKGPDRQDRRCHPPPKLYCVTQWVHITSQSFRSIRLSEPLQKCCDPTSKLLARQGTSQTKFNYRSVYAGIFLFCYYSMLYAKNTYVFLISCVGLNANYFCVATAWC